jgi:hypothetical protein
MRRFLLHVLPRGFHRIRHYGLLANVTRVENLARAQELLGANTSALIAAPVRLHDDAPPAAHLRAPLPLLRCAHGDHLNLRARSRPACTTIGHGQGGMNIAAIIPRASAPFAHRPGVGEPDALRNAARSSLAPQPSPLRPACRLPPAAHVAAANPQHTPVIASPSHPRPAGSIQIPIAPSLRWPRRSPPAVSSPKAYQTPTADHANRQVQR